jgi:hypothetical protein
VLMSSKRDYYMHVPNDIALLLWTRRAIASTFNMMAASWGFSVWVSTPLGKNSHKETNDLDWQRRFCCSG